MDTFPARLAAFVFGLFYTVFGLVGFTATGFGASGRLVLFDLSFLDNLAHLGIGALGLVAFTSGVRPAGLFARVAGVVFGLAAILGLVITNPMSALPIGGWDVLLHAASAVVLLYAGFAREEEAAPS
jgi:hypothetical protein